MDLKLFRKKTPGTDLVKKRKNYTRKFLYYFPGGFTGKKYMAWEREYKWNAHLRWQEQLNKAEYLHLLADKNFSEICNRAIRIESKTNLLFSFEKMALRDAVRSMAPAKRFADGLFDWVYGEGPIQQRFEAFAEMLGGLPVKQTRVLTWPLQTVFGFIANPKEHIFLKPTVTKTAARKYQYDFSYQSRPSWKTYKSLLDFGLLIKEDTRQFKPADMIDIQSFIWVTGSEEYPD